MAFPYTVLKGTLLARQAGAKVVFLSMGAGPIDTWLGRRFIRRALESLEAQDFEDFEVIVCDNQSTDDTGAIMDDLATSIAQLRQHVARTRYVLGSWN